METKAQALETCQKYWGSFGKASGLVPGFTAVRTNWLQVFMASSTFPCRVIVYSKIRLSSQGKNNDFFSSFNEYEFSTSWNDSLAVRVGRIFGHCFPYFDIA